MRQFARHGFELASVKTIADGAGTASGTVFWHFGSKSHLCYCEVVRDALVGLAQPPVAKPRQDLADQGVGPVPVLGLKGHSRAAFDEGPQLPNGA